MNKQAINYYENLLENTGYIAKCAGFIMYTEKGKILKNHLENELKKAMFSCNIKEVEFPSIIDYNSLDLPDIIKRGRLSQCFHLELSNKKDICLIHTGEELASNYFSCKKEKEIGVFQIKSKFRYEKSENLFRKTEFTMLDAYFMELSSYYFTYKKIVSSLIKTMQKFGVKYKLGDYYKHDNFNILSQELFCLIEPNKWIEVGHFFKLGKTYNTPGYFSSYGIGIDRLFSCVALQKIKGHVI